MLCYIVWLLLVWKLDYQNLIVGFFVALVSSLLFGNLWQDKSNGQIKEKKAFYKIIFLLLRSLINCTTAALKDLLSVVFRSSVHMKEVKIELENDSVLAQMWLVHYLNCLPHTLVIDLIYGEKNYVLVLSADEDIENKVRVIESNLKECC